MRTCGLRNQAAVFWSILSLEIFTSFEFYATFKPFWFIPLSVFASLLSSRDVGANLCVSAVIMLCGRVCVDRTAAVTATNYRR